MITTISSKEFANKLFREAVVSYSDCNNALVAMLLHLEKVSPEVFEHPFKILAGDDNIVEMENCLNGINELTIKINNSWERVDSQSNSKFTMNGEFNIDDAFDNIKYEVNYAEITSENGMKVYGVIKGAWRPIEISNKVAYALEVLEYELGSDNLQDVREMLIDKEKLPEGAKSSLQKINAFDF